MNSIVQILFKGGGFIQVGFIVVMCKWDFDVIRSLIFQEFGKGGCVYVCVRVFDVKYL